MDFGRPAEDTAELRFYYRSDLSGAPRIDIEPPTGWTLVRLHRNEATTVVMVTHDARLAERTERTVRLFDGRQVQ